MSSSVLNRGREFITPECTNLSNSISIAGYVAIVIIIIAEVMLILAYMNLEPNNKNGTEAEDQKKKREARRKNYLIGGIVTTAISILLAVWQIVISGQIKKCVARTT